MILRERVNYRVQSVSAKIEMRIRDLAVVSSFLGAH